MRIKRTIYLLRHAKSGWDNPALADFERPLAPRGLQAATAMCEHMRATQVAPDLILCSSAVRTRQTLNLIRPAMRADVQIRYEPAIYEASLPMLLSVARAVGEQTRALMMIGHSPGMPMMASELAGSAEDPDARVDRDIARLRAKYPTAALTTLELQCEHWHELGPAACVLRSFVTPRDLRDR